MLKSRNVDYALRTFVVLNKFFSKGWGSVDIFKRVAEFQNLAKDEQSFVRDVYGVLERTEVKISKGKKIKNNAVYNIP